jgi:hypothetical protein
MIVKLLYSEVVRPPLSSLNQGDWCITFFSKGQNYQIASFFFPVLLVLWVVVVTLNFFVSCLSCQTLCRLNFFVLLWFVVSLVDLPISILLIKLMSSGKQEFDVDWQRAAASLLVAIGSHDPDLVCFSQPFFPSVLGDNHEIY